MLLKEIEKNRNSGFQIQTLVTPACLSVNSWEVRQVHPFTRYTSQTKCVIQHRLDKISSLWCHKELGLHCIPSQVNGNKSSLVAGSEYWYRLPATLVLIQMCGSHNKVRFRSFFYALNTGINIYIFVLQSYRVSFFYFLEINSEKLLHRHLVWKIKFWKRP